MRILRLDLETGDELDLHPYVTVLGGLDPGAQSRIIDSFSRIARGDVEGLSGLLEAHGMLVEIDPVRVASLELPPDADVVVEAEQLPGATLLAAPDTESERDREMREQITSVEGDLARIDDEIHRVADQLDHRTAELDEARRALDEFAVTAHEAALRAVDEAESLARQRAHGGRDDPPPAPPEPSPDAQRRERLASELAERRRRHDDFETLLDEERLGLLQLLEQLEAERATLDDLRAELADEASAAEPADPPPEPGSEPEPAESLPDRTAMAEVEQGIREVLAGPPEAETVPSLPAAALADQVAAHRQRQREFERELAERGLDPGAVRARLAEARSVEAEAGGAATPRTVAPEDDREIERLHDEVIENVDKRTSRRHGREATRVYEAANAKLEVLLGRYGFPTYAAYLMDRTMPTVDEGARQRHDEAQRLVAQLERELEEVVAAAESDPHARMLQAEREQLWSAAKELLGELPEDVEGALRRLRVPGHVEFDAPDRLRDRLRRLGVDVANAATTASLVELADQWLTDANAAHDRAEALASTPADDGLPHVRLPGGFTASEAKGANQVSSPLEQRVIEQETLVEELLQRSIELDAELTDRESESERLAAEIAAIEVDLVSLDEAHASSRAVEDEREAAATASAEAALETRTDSDPAVVSAREQAALTEARLQRHHGAVERVDRLHAAIGELRRSERSLIAERDSIRGDLEAMRAESSRLGGAGAPLPAVEWQLTEEGVGPIEWYLLGRVASLRSVSPAGSVPLVLNDAFRGLPSSEVESLCDALARIGETVQVIYLGDELAVTDWAQRQGLDHAAVVRPGQPAM